MAISPPGSVRSRSRRVSCEAPAFVRAICSALDTKLARALNRALTGDHREVIALGCDPRDYTNADLFARDWLAVNIMSKYPKLNLGIDTAEAAYGAFRESESACRLTNARLKARYDTPTTGISGESLIESAREKIARLLGPFSWSEASDHFGFSGGATTRRRRSLGDAYHKFRGKPDVTRHLALLACCAIESSPSWALKTRSEFGIDYTNWVNVVSGSRITTVPKNAKTDRVICVEPCMNIYVQRGIGFMIRSRLRRCGIDLNTQLRNQEFARRGSLDGSFATIDLKAASDSISYELVRRLLPSDWFEAMDMARSKVGTLPSGEVVHFQKFSSMGNGFTFELESMIFWALAEAVVDLYAGSERRVLVYGDDIIVPTATAGWLIELLSYVGFQTNESKSFVDGPFRESCGKHYFNGIDVTPFYIRDRVDSSVRLYWLANSVRRWAGRATDGAFADVRYKRIWDDVVQKIPKPERLFIPEGFGDGGLIGTFSEACPRYHTRPGKKHPGFVWSVRLVQEGIGRIAKVHDVYAYLRALNAGGCGTSLTDLLVSRDRKWKRRITLYTSQWNDAPLW